MDRFLDSETLQGLWVVGFGGGSMDLGATTSAGGDGHSAMAIVKALDNDRTGGNHVCPAMLYSLVLIAGWVPLEGGLRVPQLACGSLVPLH